MRRYMKTIGMWCVLMMAVLMLSGLAFASADDNSLYDLGITTEGATVEPAFDYSVWECTVTVPAGTRELSLSPITSSESATISSIEGTTLDESGNSTVYITVRSASGSEFTYTVHVQSDGPIVTESAPTPETEPATEAAPQTEPETEPQTEDNRYVKVDKNTIQEAENTITSLKGEITSYKETVSLYTKVMYGLIAAVVIMLFIIINMSIRRRDLKSELREYRAIANGQQGMSKKEIKRAEKEAKKAAKLAAKQGTPQPPQNAPMQNMRQPQQGGNPQMRMPNPPQQNMPQQNVQPQRMPSQRVPHRQVVPQNVGGLDVMPQVSRKPQTPPAPVQNAAPASQASVQNAAPAPQTPVQNAAPAPQTPVKNAAPAPKAPAQNTAPATQAPAQNAAPAPQAPAAEKKAGGVEVNMIDL